MNRLHEDPRMSADLKSMREKYSGLVLDLSKAEAGCEQAADDALRDAVITVWIYVPEVTSADVSPPHTHSAQKNTQSCATCPAALARADLHLLPPRTPTT